MRITLRLVTTAAIAFFGFVLAGSQAGAQTYEPSTCGLALSTSSGAPGDTITVSTNGGCYAAGSTVTITMASDPVTLGTATADASGMFSAPVTIPSNASVGEHTISATGPGADGGSVSLTASFTVLANATAAAPGAAPAQPALAFTGSSDTPIYVGVGVVLVVVGAVLLVLTARRRRAHSS